jgi:AcrR family transcriptional regulator
MTASHGEGLRQPGIADPPERYSRPVDALPGHLGRLPPGREDFTSDVFVANQHQRILAAVADLVSAHGYQGTSIASIVKRAGVARVTFYDNFENREAALLAVFDNAVADAHKDIRRAVEGLDAWPDQLRAGLNALLEYIRSMPAVARTCIVESLTAGPRSLERFETAIQSFIPAIRRGREWFPEAPQMPDTLEESLLGGVVWMIHHRLLAGETEQIPDLLPEMLEFVLTPYMGAEHAAEFATGQPA